MKTVCANSLYSYSTSIEYSSVSPCNIELITTPACYNCIREWIFISKMILYSALIKLSLLIELVTILIVIACAIPHMRYIPTISVAAV